MSQKQQTKICEVRMALVVQWLRLHALNAGSTGVVPNWGSKIPLAKWCNQKNIYVCELLITIRNKSKERNKNGRETAKGQEQRAMGFPGGSEVKDPHANARDTGLIPSAGRFHMLWSN